MMIVCLNFYRVIKNLQIYERFSSRVRAILFLQNSYNTFLGSLYPRKMETDLFKGVADRFHGVTVHSENEVLFDDQIFATKLQKSLVKWNVDGTRTVWFHVSLKYSKWLPILSENNFRFHRVCEDGNTVVMYRWLPKDKPSAVPPYAHTMVGVGGMVFNSNNELLVVLQRFGSREIWKLPGGYVEPRENLADAAVREVEEETGIKTEFQSCILFRHTHFANFDCSDLYFVVHLEPLTNKIDESSDEIEGAKWMAVDEFVNHPKVHDLNRLFVKTFQRYKKSNIKMVQESGLHPVTNKPYSLFLIDDDSTT